MAKITATKVGDWGKALRTTRGLLTAVPRVSIIMYDEARDTKERIQENIRRQEYDWPALSDVWKKEKARRGLDPRILIAHGDYVDAVRILPLGPHAWSVGIGRRQKNREGDSLAEIGLAHEYGKGKLPPRAHWRREYWKARLRLEAKITALMAGRL